MSGWVGRETRDLPTFNKGTPQRVDLPLFKTEREAGNEEVGDEWVGGWVTFD